MVGLRQAGRVWSVAVWFCDAVECDRFLSGVR